MRHARLVGLTVVFPWLLPVTLLSQEAGDPAEGLFKKPISEMADLSMSPRNLYEHRDPGALSPGGFALDLRPLASSSPLSATASSLAPDSVGLLGSGASSYFMAKAGPLWFLNDLDDLGAGFNTEVALGFQPVSFLALELQSGYFWGEDVSGSDRADLWGMPLVANLRLSMPLLVILSVYGGGGVGGYYTNLKVRVPPDSERKDDFTFGGNIFAGVSLDLGPLFIGVEGKYIVTEKIRAFEGDINLEGFAAMACLGVRF